MKIESIGLEAGNAQLNRTDRSAAESRAFDRTNAVQPQTERAVQSGSDSAALNRDQLKERTKEAAEKISSFVNFNAADLQFTVDDETDTPIVKVVDRATKEVIRQIPSEEAIELSKALDKISGLLIKNQA